MKKKRPIPKILKQSGPLKSRRIRTRVSLLLLQKNHVYLLKNIINQREIWFLPGGSVHWGETLHDTAKREGKEELGLEINVKRLLALLDNISPANDFHSIEAVFLVNSKSQDITPNESLEKGEVTKNKYAVSGDWFSLEALSTIEVYPKHFIVNSLPKLLKNKSVYFGYLGNDWD